MSATDHPPPSLAAEEEAFRALLDAAGLLRPELVPAAFAPPDRAAAYAIFAQQDDARFPVAPLKQRASQFFGARVGLTVDKRYDLVLPAMDAARVVLASDDATARGTRLVFARAVEPDDLATASEAEARTGAPAAGLAQLARRCRTMFLVVPRGEDDRAALTLAAILASVLLGPILAPGGGRIFGVRTARLDLEARARPYR